MQFQTPSHSLWTENTAECQSKLFEYSSKHEHCDQEMQAIPVQAIPVQVSRHVQDKVPAQLARS